MKVKRFSEATDFQQFVLATMASYAPGWYNREQDHEISFTINGVEIDFYKWCDRLEFAFDESVIEKARELAIEKFGDLMTACGEFSEQLEEMHSDLETRIRNELELPMWEDRFGE